MEAENDEVSLFMYTSKEWELVIFGRDDMLILNIEV